MHIPPLLSEVRPGFSLIGLSTKLPTKRGKVTIERRSKQVEVAPKWSNASQHQAKHMSKRVRAPGAARDTPEYVRDRRHGRSRALVGQARPDALGTCRTKEPLSARAHRLTCSPPPSRSVFRDGLVIELTEAFTLASQAQAGGRYFPDSGTSATILSTMRPVRVRPASAVNFSDRRMEIA